MESINSHIFSGNIDSITFEGCRFGVIHAFCISGVPEDMFSFSIQNSIINRLEPQVSQKKNPKINYYFLMFSFRHLKNLQLDNLILLIQNLYHKYHQEHFMI